MMSGAKVPKQSSLSAYQKRLLVFLSVATLFEGYEFIALAQILPNIRAEFGLDPRHVGVLFAIVNLGGVLAFFLVRRADRWGRRPTMMLTIVGYTCFTFLTGLASDIWTFGACQLAARAFLMGELALSMVYAAEEFPARLRGAIIGIIQGFSSVGSILCAATAPVLISTTYGWRSVYFIGIVPLAIMAYSRRSLRETRRFAAQKDPQKLQSSLLALMKSGYRRRTLQLGAIWFFTYACSNTAVGFWKDFAVVERGLSNNEVGMAISVAAVSSLPAVFLTGKLLDRVGRRPGAAIIFCATIVGVYSTYSLDGLWPLTAALWLAFFGLTGTLSVLNAYNSELFPTAIRADAFAWANNLIGRWGYVISPVVIGFVADEWGWSAAIRPTVIFLGIALVMILVMLPETNRQELEQSSRLTP